MARSKTIKLFLMDGEATGKLIAKTETAAWKEQQPKKQFELYTRLRGYKQELDKLKNGKNALQDGAN